MDLHHLGPRFFVSGIQSPATLHYAIAVRQSELSGPGRMANFIPLASLFRAEAVVAGGPDHMVGFDPNTSINPYRPFLGMWIAITRKAVDGTIINLFDCLSLRQALRMYTLNAAYLPLDKKKKGPVEPGKMADMVVINRNYLTCPVNDIKDIQALRTIVGGRIVFNRLHCSPASRQMFSISICYLTTTACSP